MAKIRLESLVGEGFGEANFIQERLSTVRLATGAPGPRVSGLRTESPSPTLIPMTQHSGYPSFSKAEFFLALSCQ